MNLAAKATNKVTMLGEKHQEKPRTSPAVAIESLDQLYNLRKIQSSLTSTSAELDLARQKLAASRLQYKREARGVLALDRDNSDSNLHQMLTNPSAAYKAFRKSSSSFALLQL